MNLAGFRITRANHIEFNNSTQHWKVQDRKGKVRFIAKSRSAWLEWEHQNVQSGYLAIKTTPHPVPIQADNQRSIFTVKPYSNRLGIN